MSIETKKTALPKLRFPELQEAEEWVEKPLGSIMTVTSCKRVHESDWTTKGVPFFRAREIVALRNKVEISPLFISETLYQKNIKQSGEIKPGDLLVTGVGTIGVPYSVKEGDRFYFKDGNIIWFQNPGDIVSGNFLFWLYESNYIKKQISRMAGIGTVGTYTIDNAKRTLIPLSSKEEQQKIADCFSSLDDLINAQNAKLAALQAHKRGLMQGLFPAEGETVPKLRFPEFQDADEWKEKTLGGIVTFSSGGTPSKDKPEYWDGDTPWISASSMHSYVLDKSELYITDIAKKAGAAIVGEGVLLLLVRGSMLFKRIPMGITAREVAFNQDVKALHIDKGIAPQYLLYYLVSAESLLLAMVSATGIGAGKLDTAELKQFPVFIPSSAEQEKIIECLTAVDNRITAQSQKIEALKLHKKGLMQNLFPAAAEPTA